MKTILAWTHAVLEITPARWRELMAKLPSDLLTRSPAAGEWSALDCLQHLVDAERWVFPVRVEAIMAGQSFPAFDPDSTGEKSDTTQSPTALVEEFSRMRADSLTLLKKLTVEDLNRQAQHEQLGVVTMSELIHEWGGHDLMHTVQAERALMQPFIQGCGPWQSLFSDHFVEPA